MFGLFGTKELSGGEVLRKVYDAMVRSLDAQPQKLPRELFLVIADDSDHHRSRTGYMKYESGHLARIGDAPWFLAVGESYGDYPARPFHSDLLALRLLSWTGPEDVRKHYDGPFGAMVRGGMSPFSDSLLVAMASGALECPGRFGKNAGRVREILASDEIRAFATQEVKRDSRYLAASDLRPAVTSPAKFSSKLVEPLAGKLIDLLVA